MNRFIATFLLCLIAYAPCGTYGAIKTFFMEDLCYVRQKATIDVSMEKSGILMAVSSRNRNDNFQCELTLISKRGSSIVLSIYKYDISNGDSLTIQDSDRHTIGLIGWSTFKDEKKSIVSDRKLILNYVRNSSDSALSSSAFQFTFTEVNEYSSGKCLDNEFQCKNKKCILSSLTCDGHNHCGDNSDQVDCNPTIPYTPVNKNPSNTLYTALIGLSIVAAALLIVIIIIFMVVMVRAKTKKPVTPNQDQANPEIALQSVQAAPPSQPLPVLNNLQQSTNQQTQESLYNRIRQSFRSNKRVNAEAPKHQEPIQVPSMYPNLEQAAPSAPQYSGEDNPNFKPEE